MSVIDFGSLPAAKEHLEAKGYIVKEVSDDIIGIYSPSSESPFALLDVGKVRFHNYGRRDEGIEKNRTDFLKKFEV